jgi:hypothetical protein
MTSNTIFERDVLAGLSGLLAEPAFDAFKRNHITAREAPVSAPKDVFDVLALMMGRAEPERIATPMGRLPLDPDLLHEREITHGLMPTAEYRHGTAPQSKAVRDTVLAFFDGAYPGRAKYELGRMSPISENPRTDAAWPGLRNASGGSRPVGPLSNTKPAEFPGLSPDERKKAIGQALAEHLEEGASA